MKIDSRFQAIVDKILQIPFLLTMWAHSPYEVIGNALRLPTVVLHSPSTATVNCNTLAQEDNFLEKYSQQKIVFYFAKRNSMVSEEDERNGYLVKYTGGFIRLEIRKFPFIV